MGNASYLWVFVVLGALLVYAINFFALRYTDFRRELWYINMEMERSDEEERCLWRKEKQKLLLSLIPFVRY